MVRQERQRGGTAAATAGLLSRLLRHEDKLDNVPNARPMAASRPEFEFKATTLFRVSNPEAAPAFVAGRSLARLRLRLQPLL